MVRNLLFYVILVTGVPATFSCNSSGDANDPSPIPTVSTGESAPAPTPEKPHKEQTAKERLKNDPMIRETDNMSSSLRFAETNEFTSIWGGWLKRSKWAKEIHHGDFVVLAPTNERLRQMGDLIMKLDVPDNQALLDEIMANHVIRYPFFAEKAQEYPEVTTISGRILKVDHGQHMIGGAQFYPTQINTKNGSVIWMMDIIDFPEEKLRKAPDQK